jgi:hypothetical protein
LGTGREEKRGFKSDIAKTLIDPKKGEVVKTDWGFKLMLNGAQLSDITNYEIEGSDNITSDDDIRNELIRKASGYNKLTIQGGISDMPFQENRSMGWSCTQENDPVCY